MLRRHTQPFNSVLLPEPDLSIHPVEDLELINHGAVALLAQTQRARAGHLHEPKLRTRAVYVRPADDAEGKNYANLLLHAFAHQLRV